MCWKVGGEKLDTGSPDAEWLRKIDSEQLCGDYLLTICFSYQFFS